MYLLIKAGCFPTRIMMQELRDVVQILIESLCKWLNSNSDIIKAVGFAYL